MKSPRCGFYLRWRQMYQRCSLATDECRWASVQSYLDELTNRRAILGGAVWIDPELNTEATLKAGKLYLNFDIEPPAPLEHLVLQAHRNGDYYEELVLSVTGNQQ